MAIGASEDRALTETTMTGFNTRLDDDGLSFRDDPTRDPSIWSPTHPALAAMVAQKGAVERQ
jgi:hypothetical protein